MLLITWLISSARNLSAAGLQAVESGGHDLMGIDLVDGEVIAHRGGHAPECSCL